MKYSLSYRVSPKYLAKADEIRIPYKAIERVGEFAEKYPNAALLLEADFTIPTEQELQTAATLARGRLKARITNLETADYYESFKIPYIWSFSPKDLYELDALYEVGVSEIQVNSVFFFQMSKEYRLPLRFNPTEAASQAIVPNVNAIISPYMRPEDQKMYEGRIDILELSAETPEKEEALFRIYAEEGEWPGRIDFIIPVETDAVNRMIPPEFALVRYDCALGCLRGTRCHLCERYLKMADPDLVAPYAEYIKQN